MKPNLTIKLRDNQVSDFKCYAEGWHILENEISHEGETISFFRWAYARPESEFMTRISIRVGEHNPEMLHKNRYFISGSRYCTSYKLTRTQTFDATLKEINRIAEETNAKYESEWNWQEKYPEIQRFGIKPTEMELEEMTKEDRAKLPKHINYVW